MSSRDYKALKAVFSALAIAVAGVGPAVASEEKPAQQAAPNLPAIVVTAIKRGPIVDRVRGSGLISEVELVSVQPRIEGQAVEELGADVGDRVEQGQVLAVLSETALLLKKSQLEAQRASAEATIAQAGAQIAEAEAAASEATRQAERAKTLAGKGIGTQSVADQAATSAETSAARVNSARQAERAAQAQLKLIDAQIEDVDLQLARTQIKAPVGGLIVTRNAQVGSIASAAGQPMFSILRDGELELRADVSEGDLLKLQPGQKAIVSVAGLNEPISGKVRLVEPTVNTQTRLGRVRITIEEPERVRWGMFADAEIVVEEHQALVAPVASIGLEGNRATALKVADGVVEQVTVVTGIRDGDRVEVLSGLAEGDAVVAKAGAFVRDGDRINPVMQEVTAGVSN